MDNRAPLVQEINASISSLINKFMSSEKDEGFLVSLAAKLAFLDENEKNGLAQYLSEDNGPFGQSTPEILASLLDYCEEITKQQATEANEATIFLISVLSTYPKLLKKNLEIRLKKILLTIQFNDSDKFLPEELVKLDDILASLENNPTLDKITKELFQSFCKESHVFDALIQLHKRCKDSSSRAGQWLCQNTTEENLGIYTFSAKKTRFDARLPDVITLLIYQKTFEEQASLRQFYEIYAENDILPTTKMMELAKIASEHTEIIKAHDLRTQAIDLGIRRQAVLYMVSILRLRMEAINHDYSRLLNSIKKASINHPSAMAIFDNIETKLVSDKMSVAAVMRGTIKEILPVLADDVDDLFSNSPDINPLEIMSAFIQGLLKGQNNVVLYCIHSKITYDLSVALGRVTKTAKTWFNPDDTKTLCQQAIAQTIVSIDYTTHESSVLDTIELQASSIIEDIEKITIFLQQICKISFETTFSESLQQVINTAAEMYIQQKIFAVKSKTTKRCEKIYKENQMDNSFQKLQKMGEIASKRTQKRSKSQYNDLYKEIASFRHQDSGNELDNSNHSIYSESSRMTTFSPPPTPPRKMTPLESQEEEKGHNLTIK